MRRLASVGALLGVLALVAGARAITREEVILRAHAIAYHPWRCSAANLTGTCGGGYQSVYTEGDFLGLPYDWGGYISLFDFDQKIAQGYAAGSYPSDGVLACTVGLDCSGFVSQAWGVSYHTTTMIPDISTVVDQASILPGDVFNQAGYHVILYERTLASGDPVFYESVGYNVHVNATGGWSYVSGYTPRRLSGISGTTVGNPVGTVDNPIVISSFPYTDSRDTRQSVSDVLDGCGAAPGKSESGPEYIYRVTFTQPGQLTATIADDAATDIDIHLYTSLDTNDCIARNDTTITVAVDCGTYYLVADTFRSSGGTEYPGPYTLTATFTPSGAACGSGPPAYHYAGALGTACGYPGHEDLPFCNENLGADTCIYTTSPPSSFCSRACTGAGDCTAFAGGCCGAIGSGEYYCLPAAWCASAADGGGIDAGVMPQDGGPKFDGPPPDAPLLVDAPAAASGDGGGGAGDDGGAGPGSDDAGAGPGSGDAGAGGDGHGGCGVAAGGGPGPGVGCAPLLAFLLVWVRRRRRAR